VTRQGGRTNRGAHDRATNDSSDDDWWEFRSVPQEIQVVTYWILLRRFGTTKHLTKQLCTRKLHVLCSEFHWKIHNSTGVREAQRMGTS
jgi:hypothetical protein